MFGRAGRPGQESEGNAILVQWEKPVADLDLYHLLTCPTENVVGHGLVRPRPLLSRLLRNYQPESLLNSPFSSRDTSFYPKLIEQAQTYIRSLNARPDIVRDIMDLESCIADVKGRRWNVSVGDTVILASGPRTLRPVRAAITSVRPLRANGHNISWKWILHHVPKNSDSEESLPEKLARLMESQDATADELRRGSEVVMLEKEIIGAKFSMTPKASPYYDDLQALLQKLESKGFLSDGILTSLGKMVPSLVGCEDPLSLVVAWTSNAIPRDSESSFAAGLSCFLMNKRNNQPADSRGIYDPLCKIQESVSGEVEIGTAMVEPMHMWIKGNHSVADIVRLCDSNPGHISKTVLSFLSFLNSFAMLD